MRNKLVGWAGGGAGPMLGPVFFFFCRRDKWTGLGCFGWFVFVFSFFLYVANLVNWTSFCTIRLKKNKYSFFTFFIVEKLMFVKEIALFCWIFVSFG